MKQRPLADNLDKPSARNLRIGARPAWILVRPSSNLAYRSISGFCFRFHQGSKTYAEGRSAVAQLVPSLSSVCRADLNAKRRFCRDSLKEEQQRADEADGSFYPRQPFSVRSRL